MFYRRKFFSWMLLILPTLSLAVAKDPLTTEAEQSGWKITGRYDEVPRLCEKFAHKFPKQVKCQKFGTSPEGRGLFHLVVSSGDKKSHKKKPVVFFQGGIHPGEIDGKDAGFLVLREWLTTPAGQAALKKVTLVFVPIFNVDGHERFGKNNRPNQIGPEEMGWRTTSQNLNLNRDYMKAETPEMAAMLKLLQQWDPILYIDLHVTDGAEFQHAISVLIQPSEKGPEGLRQVGKQIQNELMKKLELGGHLPLPFYPAMVKNDDPASGFPLWISTPRYSHAYWGLHNRFGVLVETHSWKDYGTRVKATADTLRALVEMAARDGEVWLKAAAGADSAAKEIADKNVELAYDNTEHAKMFPFKGYAYQRTQSEISGETRIRYDKNKPEIWNVPLYDLKVAVSEKAPGRGYIIPVAQAGWVAEKLSLHGIRFEVMKASTSPQEVETFRAEEVILAKESFEGRVGLKIKGEWAKEKRVVPRGSLFIPIAQPLSQLVMQLLEPKAPDSFLAWGFFHSAFEKKEYMENYVTEAVAEEMLVKDPDLKKEFAKKLDDPEFAKSPGKRLEFFYRRHPSWDERYYLYPIYRVAQ